MMQLRTAYSGDPDDAFAWWGIETGSIADPELSFQFSSHSIASINRACERGEFDIAAISAASYPLVARDYAILSSGASVARNCGPALVAAEGTSRQGAFAGTFAVAGASTTGGLIFRLLHPETPTVDIHWRQIPAEIRRGSVSGGVCIHETLMQAEDSGLRKLGCLGAEWNALTGLPLPVGLVIGRRSLGTETLARVARLLSRSVRLARRQRAAAMCFAATYSIGLDRASLEAYVDRFTNDDTQELPDDARQALKVMYVAAARQHLLPPIEELNIIAASHHGADSHAA